MTEDQMFSRMVSDIQQGVDGTNVRAGIIGEIGISQYFHDPVMAGENRAHVAFEKTGLRAACRAHLATGAALSIHFPPLYPHNLADNSRNYDDAISILRNSGCTAFDRIVFSHLVSTSDPNVNAKLEQLAAQGINLAFDLFGTTEPPYIEDGSAIASLIEKGYINQLLVSQDVYQPAYLKVNGGPGYSYILENLASYFRQPHAQTGTHVTSGDAKVWLADISGDGKADLVAQGGAPDYDHGQIHVALSTGTGFSMWTSISDGRVSNTAKVWLADVDGDGKADLVVQGGPDDYDHGQIYVALSNRAGNGFEMWTSHTEESLVDDNGRVWFQNITAGKAAEMVYLPGNNQNNYDMLQYFSHPIGVSARDMQQIMVVNARRILEITVPCGQRFILSSTPRPC
jgi:Phosphotriesterase family/FG-GAP-like repeat